MFSKTNKTKKGFIGAIAMSLVLLMGSALGCLIETNLGQISPPATDSWENFTSTPSGVATESDPWIINSEKELAYLINNINDGTYYIELNSDIDLGAHNWIPIKTKGKNLKLNFNGNNHTISNMTIYLPNKAWVGFFEGITYELSDATMKVENITFSNVDVRGRDNVGAVSGYMGRGEINNVNITSGKVVGNLLTGGLAPMCWATITNCVNNADVTSFEACAGGIKGWGGGIYNCVNSGTVTGGGDRSKRGTYGWIGGITAFGGKGSGLFIGVENCFSCGDIIARGNNVRASGIAPRGDIINSGFYGAIYIGSTAEAVSAINVGAKEADGTITNSFGVADIYIQDESVDPSVVNEFGAYKTSMLVNSYCYTKIYAKDSTHKFRKYIGDDFSGFAYHKNINGGYPFPRSLFAVGQFIECDTLSYLEEYGFNTPPVIMNDGSYYYVNLGKYPQTYVGDDLNTTLKAWYTSSSPISVGSYHIDTKDFNVYKYTDGEKYVRVESANVWTSEGYFTQGGQSLLKSGQEYWFKVEPIKWRVLNYTDVQSGTAPIVIAEHALATIGWNDSSDGNLWTRKCKVRDWLNNSFYNEAFNGGYGDYIISTTLKNNSSYSNDDGTGNDSQDNVWLLSYNEANGKYESFNSNDKRICTPTDFVLVNFYDKESGSCWLRSARTDYSMGVWGIGVNGSLGSTSIYYSYNGVRPVLTLDI